MNIVEFARFVRGEALHVLEPHLGEWVNNNIWGDQRFGPLPGAANQVVQVLAKNTHLYGPPAVHTVQLARSDEVLAGNADVYARIEYGCGGVRNTFLCDWLHGCQIALVCNQVNVNAVSYAPNSVPAYNAASASIALRASVAKGGTCPSRCPATFTGPSISLGPGPASYTIAVPDFARDVIVHMQGNNDPGTATTLNAAFFNQGSGFQLANYDLQVFAGGRSCPIPGGTNAIEVLNPNVGVTKLVTVQFLLGF